MKKILSDAGLDISFVFSSHSASPQIPASDSGRASASQAITCEEIEKAMDFITKDFTDDKKRQGFEKLKGQLIAKLIGMNLEKGKNPLVC